MRRFSGNKKNKQGEANATNANANNPNSLPRPSALGATSASASGSSSAKPPQPMLTTDPATLLIDPPSPKTTFEKVTGSFTQRFRRKSSSKQESSAQASGAISATDAEPPITDTIASTSLERINSPKSSILENLTSPFSALRKSFSSSKESTDTSNSTKEKKRWSLTKRGKNKQDNDAVTNLDSAQTGNIDDLNEQKDAIKKVASSIGLFDSPYKTHDFTHIDEEEGSMSGNSAAKEANQAKGKRKDKRKKGKIDKEEQVTIQTTQGSNEEQNKASESSLVESEKSENESFEQIQQDEKSSDAIQSNAEQAVGNEDPKQVSFFSSVSNAVHAEFNQTKSEIVEKYSKLKSELHSDASELIQDTATSGMNLLVSTGLGVISGNNKSDIKQTTITQSTENYITSGDNKDVTLTQEGSPKNSHRRNQSTGLPLANVSGLGIKDTEANMNRMSTPTINNLQDQEDRSKTTYHSLPKASNANNQSTDQSFNIQAPNTDKKEVKNKNPRPSASAAKQPKDEPKSLLQRFIARIGAAFSALGAFLYSLVKPIINVIWPEKDRNDNVNDNSSVDSVEPDSTLNQNDDSSDNDNSGLKNPNIKIIFSNPSTNRSENNHGNTTTETKKPSKGFGCSIL